LCSWLTKHALNRSYFVSFRSRRWETPHSNNTAVSPSLTEYKLPAEDGEKILEVQDFQAALENRMLYIEIQAPDGGWSSVSLHLRGGGEVAS